VIERKFSTPPDAARAMERFRLSQMISAGFFFIQYAKFGSISATKILRQLTDNN